MPADIPKVIARFFEETDSAHWDQFVSESINGTMLHTRRYLSYHGPRFRDASVVVYSGKELAAVIPAAWDPSDEAGVVSHPGSTFGGLVQDGGLGTTGVGEALGKAIRLWRSAGAIRLRYHPAPSIYMNQPTEEDRYTMWREGFAPYKVYVSSTLDLLSASRPSENRRRRTKARSSGAEVVDDIGHLSAFWEVLSANLLSQHGTTPTHSLPEIAHLAEKFPETILLRTATLDGAVVAGVVLYILGPTCHAQYIASSDAGRKLNATAEVLTESIAWAREAGYRWFDFGHSVDPSTLVVNEGLERFKRSFGATGTCQVFYRIDFE
jgi:hypothetical protein